MDIYLRPRTQFVAGFVGDNNVLNGLVTNPAAGLFEVDGLGPVTGTPVSLLRNSPVTLAIRPEAIHRMTSSGPTDNPLSFHVSGMVNFGDNILLHGAIGSRSIKVRLSGSEMTSVRIGEQLSVVWDRHSTHVIPSKVPAQRAEVATVASPS